jgi:hypothetical protein
MAVGSTSSGGTDRLTNPMRSASRPARQGPDHRGVVAGGDAEGDVRVDEAGVVGGDGDVGQERHGQAATGRRPVDGRHHRLVQLDHAVDDVDPLPRHALEDGEGGLLVQARDGPQAADVGAHVEVVTGAGDHHGPDVVVPAEGRPDLRNLAVDRRLAPPDRPCLGDAHQRDPVLDLDGQLLERVIASHRRTLPRRRPPSGSISSAPPGRG